MPTTISGTTVTTDSVTTDSVTLSGGAKAVSNNYFQTQMSSYRAGEVIETITSACDGSSVTVLSGTYAMANVTAAQALSSTYADVTGSSIDYTPPEGTKKVHYRFEFKLDAVDYSGISHYKLLIDGTEVIQAYKNYAGSYQSNAQYLANCRMEWVFDINAGYTDLSRGKIQAGTWTTAKTIKVQAREYSTSYDAQLHSNVWRDGGGATGEYLIDVPHLEVRAIA